MSAELKDFIRSQPGCGHFTEEELQRVADGALQQGGGDPAKAELIITIGILKLLLSSPSRTGSASGRASGA